MPTRVLYAYEPTDAYRFFYDSPLWGSMSDFGFGAWKGE
jgi:hypothetical protein